MKSGSKNNHRLIWCSEEDPCQNKLLEPTPDTLAAAEDEKDRTVGLDAQSSPTNTKSWVLHGSWEEKEQARGGRERNKRNK